MASMTPDTSTPKDDLILLAALFLGELSIAVMTMAIYMKGNRSLEVFLSSKPGVMFSLAIAGFFVSGAGIIYQYMLRKRSPSRYYRMIVAMNIITVFLMLVTAELALRAISRSTSQAVTVLGMELLPKNWGKIVLHYRKLLNSETRQFTYVVYDDIMGWTVGPNKQSSDGMYWSSSEGIRALQAEVTFADSTERARIALIGDSFAFSQDVKYEDSWGYLLEQALDSKFQVLNFGVPGYAVDQAYLRYEKDVLKWKPKIIIFGFIANDVMRSMTVYPFIKFPRWNWPYSKPRFILRDGSLVRINVPPLPPEAIFSRESPSELPFVEYDSGYKQNEWHKSQFQVSYLIRLLITKFPRWIEVSPDISIDALVSVNASILKDFVRSARQRGVIPIVTYFPSQIDFAPPEVRRVVSEFGIAKQLLQVLQQANFPYTDLTPCLEELNPDDRFVPQKSHYSPQANAAVASCLRKVVTEVLDQPS